MKLTPAFFFLLSAFTAYAQTGDLHITFHPSGTDSTFFVARQQDSAVKKGVPNDKGIVIIDSLPSGIYNLEEYTRDTLRAVHMGIVILDSEVTELELYQANSSTHYRDHRPHFFFEDVFSYQLGPAEHEEDSTFAAKSLFGLYAGREGFYFPGKHYGIGFSLASSMQVTSFKQGVYSGFDFENEYYFAWNACFGLLNRIIFTKHYPDKRKALFLDAGAICSLPFVFRHVMVIENVKAYGRYMTEGPDVEAAARFGYGRLTAEAQYRLRDFLVREYPETPHLRLGICFHFPAGKGV